MMLSENLSVAEFSKSDTTKRKGIDNTPKGTHLEAAKELAEKEGFEVIYLWEADGFEYNIQKSTSILLERIQL